MRGEKQQNQTENEVTTALEGMWKRIEASGPREGEESISAGEAKEDRMILARRIAQLHLAYARVLREHLGEEEGQRLILEAIREYSTLIAETRRKGMKDMPDRMVHDRICIAEVGGERRCRAYGCGIAKEWIEQDQGELGALYCYVDPCSFMLTNPRIKFYHTKLEPLGDECCEFRVVSASRQELKDVQEKGRDYRYIDPVIMKRTMRKNRRK